VCIWHIGMRVSAALGIHGLLDDLGNIFCWDTHVCIAFHAGCSSRKLGGVAWKGTGFSIIFI